MTQQQVPHERVTPAEPSAARGDLASGQSANGGPAKRRTARIAAIVAGVVLLVAAAVVVTVLVTRPSDQPAPASAPTPFSITGTITVAADINVSDDAVGGFCSTADGYSDILDGAQVTVRDSSSKVVAIGQLDAGHVAELYGEGDLPALLGFASKCEFGFTVSGVPGGGTIYSLEVAHRGQLQYNRGQLDQPLALTLG